VRWLAYQVTNIDQHVARFETVHIIVHTPSFPVMKCGYYSYMYIWCAIWAIIALLICGDLYFNQSMNTLAIEYIYTEKQFFAKNC